MNLERLQLKGMLAEAKKSLRSLDTEASGLVILIRTLLNPYENILKLDTEKALVTIKRLNEIKSEMKNIDCKVKDLESELE